MSKLCQICCKEGHKGLMGRTGHRWMVQVGEYRWCALWVDISGVVIGGVDTGWA